MVVIRENSEGEYVGAGDWLFKGQENEVFLQTGVFSRKGTERIICYAFELAKKEGKSVTSISKGNALNYSMVFWDSIFEEVSRDYPEIKTHSYLVDAARMVRLENAPDAFDMLLSAVKIGPVVFIGIPGEPFSEIGKQIKAMDGFDMIIPCCNTNGRKGISQCRILMMKVDMKREVPTSRLE